MSNQNYYGNLQAFTKPKPTIDTSKGTDIMDQLMLSQYANSPNLREFLLAYVEEMDTLFTQLDEVYLGRFLEYAEGSQLDVIGLILDQARSVALPSTYFGMAGATGADSFSDEASPFEGGFFKSEGDDDYVNTPLSDEVYRRLLFAKAYANIRPNTSLDSSYELITALLGRVPTKMHLLSGSTHSITQSFNGQFDNSVAGWDTLYTTLTAIGWENGMAWANTVGDYTFYAGLTSNASTTIEIVATRSYDITLDVVHSTGVGSTVYLIALEADGTELGRWSHKSTSDNEAHSFAETLTSSTYTGEVTLVAYEDRTQRAAYTQGNSSVTGTLDNTVTLAGDFDIEFTWERTDRSGTGINYLLGTSASEAILAYDSNHSNNPNRLTFILNGAYKNWQDALENVAQGQFIKIRLKRVGGSATLYIDDTELETKSFVGKVTIDKVLVNGSANGIIADLTIIDGTKQAKGTYLAAGNSSVVNIPMLADDDLSFTYFAETVSASWETLVGREGTSLVYINGGLLYTTYGDSLVTVDGVSYASGAYTVEEGSTIVIGYTINSAQSIVRLSNNSGGTAPAGGVISDFTVNRTQTKMPAGDYWLFDSNKYVPIPAHDYTGDFDVSVTWQRMDTTSGNSGTNLLDSVDNNSRLVANDSAKVNFPNLLFVRINGTNYSATGALVGVAQGQVIDILVTRRNGFLTYYIDGAIVGTSSGNTSTWSPDLISSDVSGTRSLGVISDVGLVDYDELPKGDYLLSNNTAYTNVNIPIAIGDTVEFDCIFGDTSTSVGLFDGRATTNLDGALSDTFMVLDGDGTYNMGTGNCFVDGVSVDTNDTYPTDGLLHKISFVATQNGYIDTIGAVSTSKANVLKGTVANFNVNNGEFLYALNNITDNGDSTAIAPQTGTTAEYGSELVTNGDFATDSDWSIVNGDNGASVVFSSGQVTLTRGSVADVIITQTLTGLNIGSVYKLEVDVDSSQNGTKYSFQGGIIPYTTDTGTLTAYVIATSTSTAVSIQKGGSTGSVGVFNNISVKETTNGFIPVFDEDTNLISYASNKTYYPFNETVAGDNYEVLAYEGPQRDAWKESGTLTIPTGWTDLGSGSFSCDTNIDYKTIDNRNLALGPIVDGSTVIVKYEVYDYVKGGVQPIAYSETLYRYSSDGTVTANGFYENQFDLTFATGSSTHNRVGFRSRNSVDGFTGKIRNITFEIVPKSWVGPNVFVNGDFSDGVGGWSISGSSSIITDDGGVLKAEKIGSASTWMARAAATLSPVVEGKTYTLNATVWADAGNTGGFNPRVTIKDNTTSDNIAANIDISDGYTFVAPAGGSVYMTLTEGTGAVNGDIFYIDDITLTEKVDGAWSTAPQLINEFDGTTYIHAMNDVVDNGDTTAYLPQTGNATSPTSYLRGQVAGFDVIESQVDLGGQTISYPLDEDAGSTFLLMNETAYVDVSIPMRVGEVTTFNYILKAGHTQNDVMFGTVAYSAALYVDVNDSLVAGSANLVFWLDGVPVVGGEVLTVDTKYTITAMRKGTDTVITRIGASNTTSSPTKGIVSNFNVNNGEYVYAMNDIVDNGDSTAAAPQSGTTAEYGSNLLVGDNTSFDSSIGSWYATNSSVIGLSWDTSGSMLMTRLTSGWVSVYTGNAILEEGKMYSIDIDVDFSSGSGFQNLYVSLGGNELGKIPTTHVGTLTFTGVSDADTAFRLYHKDNSTSQTGLIKSVVVRETSNGLIPVYNAGNNTSALYSKNLDDVTTYYAYDEDGERYSHFDGAWSGVNKLLDPTATLSSGKAYFDNITVSEDVVIAARTVELRLSSADTSTNDTALIEYFSKYLVPLGTTFTITRE
jgi:hypothetical protein